jgi:hypothetical protein
MLASYFRSSADLLSEAYKFADFVQHFRIRLQIWALFHSAVCTQAYLEVDLNF